MSESLPRTDELLSAYIDGELTEAERTQVEAWLADDPRARSLLEELQGVSAAVKSLPKSKLPADLSSAILSKVADSTSSHDGQLTHDSAASLPLRDPDRRFTGRGLWWSAAAIAAAIAIALYVPQQGGQDQRPIAQHGERNRGATEFSAPTADPLPREPLSREDVEKSGANQLDFGASDGPDSATTRESPPLLARSLPSPPAPTSQQPVGEPSAEGVLSLSLSGADNELPDDSTPTQYLVVWVDVPAQTLERRTIDQVFASNNIAVDTESENWQVAAKPVRQHIASRVASSAAELSGVQPAQTSPAATGDTPFVAASRIAEQGEAILVEATWEQVTKTLQQLQADPQNFENVTIETVAEPLSDKSSQLAEEEPLDQATTDDAPPTREQITPRPPLAEERAIDLEPTAEPLQSPGPNTGPTIRAVPPRESPSGSAPQGRYSIRQDRRDEGASPEVSQRSLGRARRLQIMTRASAQVGEPSAEGEVPPNYSYSGRGSGGDERRGTREKEERTELGAPHSGLRGGDPSQPPEEPRAEPRPTPVQVLFVLRTRPPEIAAEAAPMPAPAADPE